MSDLIDSPPTRSAIQDARGQVSSVWAPWFAKAFSILFATVQSGATADRPAEGLWLGRQYFDTTLGLPVWWNGTVWKDAAGNTV